MANYEFFGDHFSVIGQLTNVLSMEAIILGLASTREHPRQPNTALWELVRGNMGNMLSSNINNRSNPSQCVLHLKHNMPSLTLKKYISHFTCLPRIFIWKPLKMETQKNII